jgi:hypothetical protein
VCEVLPAVLWQLLGLLGLWVVLWPTMRLHQHAVSRVCNLLSTAACDMCRWDGGPGAAALDCQCHLGQTWVGPGTLAFMLAAASMPVGIMEWVNSNSTCVSTMCASIQAFPWREASPGQ